MAIAKVQDKEKEVEFWKRIARHPEGHLVFPEQRFSMIITHLMQYLEEATILEARTGTGSLAGKLADHGFTVVAVDICKDMLRQSTSIGNFHRIVADTEKGPYRSKVFDAIVMYGFLHHFPSPFETIRDLGRAGRQGSIFLAVESNGMSPYNLVKSFLKKVFCRMFGKELFYKTFESSVNEMDHKPDVYLKALVENGFQILELSVENGPAKDNFSARRALLLKGPISLLSGIVFVLLFLFNRLVSRLCPMLADMVVIVASKKTGPSKR
jgi:SAM-dependent methyltransferase